MAKHLIHFEIETTEEEERRLNKARELSICSFKDNTRALNGMALDALQAELEFLDTQIRDNLGSVKYDEWKREDK